MTQTSPEQTDVSLEAEFENILKWSAENKMNLNILKTKEIVFHRPHPNNLSLPDPMPSINRVMQGKLLGVIFSTNLKFDEHVTNILTQCSQRTYLLKVLRQQGLPLKQLAVIYQALIVSRIAYAVSAWGGFLSKDLIDKINSFFKRTLKYKITDKIFLFEDILENADKILFNKIADPLHCLHHCLPEPRTSQNTYVLRTRGHELELPRCTYQLHKKSFFPRTLFKYYKLN